MIKKVELLIVTEFSDYFAPTRFDPELIKSIRRYNNCKSLVGKQVLLGTCCVLWWYNIKFASTILFTHFFTWPICYGCGCSNTEAEMWRSLVHFDKLKFVCDMKYYLLYCLASAFGIPFLYNGFMVKTIEVNSYFALDLSV